ncbi:hypothetical protein N7449_003930 [Penicillium cf. viridicatum]|uniref:Uncharacterized protein n=1 Tax=Penicillium cf. viridicatum TaxID=2972119 RepID=A0A9W9MXY6_9EURO|nr:hypothetical protein N7449_003930 [Penicillium cf. viridicatum]
MDAIFGKKRPEELFSLLNGLLISKKLVRHFDAGKFVIVPDIPDIVRENTLVSTVKRWLHHKPQEYRVRIVDPDWEAWKGSLFWGHFVKSSTARPWNLVPDGFQNVVSKDEVSDELEDSDDG